MPLVNINRGKRCRWDLQVWNRTCLDSFQESTHSHYVTTATDLWPLSRVALLQSNFIFLRAQCAQEEFERQRARWHLYGNLRSREAVAMEWLHLDCDTLRKF